MSTEVRPSPAPRWRTGLGWTKVPLLAVACLIGTGCEYRRFAEVSGTVRVGGKPLKGAFIVFTPHRKDEVRGVGSTDGSGRYRILRPGGKFGAPVGPCTVSVHGGDNGGEIPQQYGTASQVICDVKPGRNEFDVDIPRK